MLRDISFILALQIWFGLNRASLTLIINNYKNIKKITNTVNLQQLWHKPCMDGGLINLLSVVYGIIILSNFSSDCRDHFNLRFLMKKSFYDWWYNQLNGCGLSQFARFLVWWWCTSSHSQAAIQISRYLQLLQLLPLIA